MIEINEWLSISEISGSGDKEITISASSHRELEERIKSLKFKTDEKQVYVNITQKAFVPYINVSYVPDFTQDILTRTATIKSNVPWTAIPSADWITISQTSGEEGTNNLEITVGNIYSPSDNRSGVIDFYYNGRVVSSLIITQEFAVVLIVDKTSINMTEVLTSVINVTSNSPWTCEIEDGGWFTIDTNSGIAGNSKINITALNFDYVDKYSSINFYVNGVLQQSVTIYQEIGEIEVPTDIINCFYVEPINVKEGVEITIQFHNTSEGRIAYYKDGEWNSLGRFNRTITIHKRTYFKGYTQIQNTLSLIKPCKVGGRLSSFPEYEINNTNIGFFEGTDIVDAYDLIVDSDYAKRLFADCVLLKTAPKSLNYKLENGYREAFKGCTSLVNPPELPLEAWWYCYIHMFEDCTSLTKTPELPSKTLDEYCYSNMFKGCTSLRTEPALPATTLANGCYSDMFYGCTSLVNAPALPATTKAAYCYSSMFEGCTSLVNAPSILPATELREGCYGSMFKGCTSLTTAPVLPATDLNISCYSSMFEGCTSLVNAPSILPATEISEDSCYSSMFKGCTSLRTAPALPAMTKIYSYTSFCYNSMFEGCTSLVNAPALPATELSKSCYYSMFYNCSNLNNITMLATDISAYNCLGSWVYGVSSNGTFTKKQGVEIPYGSDGIPNGWTVVEV